MEKKERRRRLRLRSNQKEDLEDYFSNESTACGAAFA
jgi:hypothetical protein